MARNDSNSKTGKKFSAQPRLHQPAAEIQAYGTLNHRQPLEWEEPVRLEEPFILSYFLLCSQFLRPLTLGTSCEWATYLAAVQDIPQKV